MRIYYWDDCYETMCVHPMILQERYAGIMRELCGNYENNFDFLTNCTSRNVQFRFFAIFELSTFWTIKINKTLFINAKYWIYITSNSTRISEFLVFDTFDLGNFPLFPLITVLISIAYHYLQATWTKKPVLLLQEISVPPQYPSHSCWSKFGKKT